MCKKDYELNFNDKENIALITELGETISYRQLLNWSEQLFCQNEKCLVLFLCTNSIECIVGYISCLRNHLVPIMLSSKAKSEAIQSMAEQYRPRYIFCPNSISQDMIGVGYRHLNDFKEYQVLEIEDSYRIDYLINDNLALLLTTSGSTGSSKLVRLSYKNLEANTNSIIEYLKITQKDRGITMLPMHYTYGLSILNTHLKAGASMVLTEKGVVDKTFWSLVNQYNVTSLSGVPYTYEVLQKLKFHTLKLKNLRYFTVAGGKLTDRQQKYLAQYAIDKKLELYIMYGQTEATARIAYLPPVHALSKIGSTGISIPGGQIEIEKETGEIIYYGENVSLGYAASYHDLLEGDKNQGKLHSGDTGYFDNEGYLYITGRMDKYAKLLGHRIDLNDVEGFIKNRMKIEAVCMVKNDLLILYLNEYNEIIKAEISRYLGINPNLILIKNYCELPRNEYGKISKI